MGRMRKPSVASLVRAADDYNRNLLNKNLILVGVNGTDVAWLEARFLSRHFKHLTGVNTERWIGANDFFRMCVDHRVSEDDLKYDISGHATMKLDAARSMFKPDLSAKSFGVANGARTYISADRYAGCTRACIGFESHGPKFCDPVTLLRSPINDEVLPKDSYKVVAMLSKTIRDDRYTTVVRQIKPDALDAVEVWLPDELKYVVEMALS